MSAFLQKLDEKKQSVQLQKLVEQAIQLYFAWVQSSKKQQGFSKKDNNTRLTTTSPNTNSDNRQEYRSLEIESHQPEKPATNKIAFRQRGALDGNICRLK